MSDERSYCYVIKIDDLYLAAYDDGADTNIVARGHKFEALRFTPYTRWWADAIAEALEQFFSPGSVKVLKRVRK